jgi:hypothetical protein
MSVPPPGAKGTMMRIGFAGQVCAADDATHASAPASA